MNNFIYLLGYLGAIIAVAVIIGFICVTIQHAIKVREDKKEIEEAEQAANITTEANETKAGARTGNHERDFNYMANKLHDIANK